MKPENNCVWLEAEEGGDGGVSAAETEKAGSLMK